MKTAQGNPGFKRKHQACRSYDVTTLEKQAVKVRYPKYVQSPRPPFFWSLPGRLKPDYGVWGVVPNPLGPFIPGHPTTHWKSGVVFYVFRRVLHAPKLRAMPRLPYLLPISGVDPFNFYPWPTYPSGQHNPRSWLP